MRIRALLVLAIAGASLMPPARAAIVDYHRPVHGPIIEHFVPPPTPFTAGHRGIDMAVPVGTLVRASAAGTVSFAGQVGGSLFVSIDHADGLRTTYSFLSGVLVRAGDVVTQGAPVARSGGCHPGDPEPCLHFGLRRGSDYLDPEVALLDAMRRNLSTVIRLVPPAG